MKGKAEISKHILTPKDINIYSIAYNKIVEDIRKDSKRTKSDSIGNDSVDFETAITKTGYGKFNYFLILLTIPAASSSAWVTGAVSFVLPVAGCEYGWSPFDKAWLNSAPYAGMVVSAFFWGFLSDTFGRQRLLTFGFLVDSLMGICASISPTLWSMVFFKFMSGIMVCGPYSIFMAYISEVFLDKYRNLAVSSAGLFSAVGNLIQPAVAWLLIPQHLYWEISEGYSYNSWRIFLLVCSTPSLICGIASAFFVESPKFLLEKGRKEEALNVFKTIYTINTGKPDTTYPVRKLHDLRSPSVIARSENEPKKSFCQVLKNGIRQAFTLLKPPFVMRILFIFFIQLGSVSSLNTLRLWLPQIFSAIDSVNAVNGTTSDDQGLCVMMTKSTEASCKNTDIKSDLYLNMILINCGGLVAQVCYVILLKFVKKKTLITITTAISAACMIALPMVGSTMVLVLTTCIMSVLNTTFFCVIGSVVEIFPTSVRATSVSLTMMCGRMGILFANVGVASIMYSHCDFIFYISFTLLMVIAISSLFLSSKPIEAKRTGQTSA